MIIYKYELKMYGKSIMIWGASIFSLLIMFMAFYPTFGSDVALVDKMMENYPPELLKAFGMSGGLSLSTVLGFFVFTFAMIQLLLGVQAANYGFSFLSVEERELTADFLMTKPVSRRYIIISKFLAALTALTITNIITWIGSFAAVEMFRDGN
jgi:ABC-2 type transport system permease protein